MTILLLLPRQYCAIDSGSRDYYTLSHRWFRRNYLCLGACRRKIDWTRKTRNYAEKDVKSRVFRVIPRPISLIFDFSDNLLAVTDFGDRSVPVTSLVTIYLCLLPIVMGAGSYIG